MNNLDQLCAYAKHCVSVLEPKIKELFNFQESEDYIWHLDTKKTQITRRKARSNGGFGIRRTHTGIIRREAYIKIHLGHRYRPGANGNNTKTTFSEYTHYANDPVIGTVFDITEFERTQLLILHEIAHAIQYYMIICSGKPLEISGGSVQCIKLNGSNHLDRGHNKLFQDIYRVLRQEFFNNGYRVEQPVYTERKRRVKRPIVLTADRERVYISCGRYRNMTVRGKFALIKPYQAHSKPKFQCGRQYLGFVTILHNGRRIRVNVEDESNVIPVANQHANQEILMAASAEEYGE